MSFQSDTARFASKTGTRMDRICRKVNIDLTKDIVRATPVDTGLARSSWFFGTNRNGTVGTETVKSGGPSLSRAAAFSGGIKAGMTWFITNNLHYIMKLEYGYSTQAPAGMARVAVARWQQIVAQAVRS